MFIDWFQTGKGKTEGREEDFLKLFDAVLWGKPPIETGYTQGYALKKIISSYKLNATHVGEVISPQHGSILAVRAKYAQGIAEIFFLDVSVTVVPLAAKKDWRENERRHKN